MSVNAVILELSQQIAHLQSQYEALVAENRQLKTLTTTTKVKRNSKSPSSQKANVYFEKSINALKEKKVAELEDKYCDELSFIRERYPRWKPKI
ncbi:MAG: hypothetical protein M5Z89_10385 [Olivibacter sp.]|nr:hypothetical protein [Olivibacter sp. UJ_SKK_5.1]